MKKILYAFVLMLGAAIGAQAAPGDSTWVQATKRPFDRGNGYGAYDTSVRFPAGTASYRKIYMEFTLGKYACPGYNPNTAGEGPGRSGWCGDWDYTVLNYVIVPGGDTVELGRLITPYANSNWPRTPLSWTQRYVYDVTDYYPILKDSAGFRVFYSGYSAGFTGNVRFLFIEGTPERNVLRVDRLWDGSYSYGNASNPINAALLPITKTAPAGSRTSVVKLNVTGHGGDDFACAEFCPNTFNLALNGNNIVTQQLFRSNCSENDLYPQSGTWTLARSNWCPGAAVNSFNYTLPSVSGGSGIQLGMSFPAYTSTTTRQGSSPASYIISGALLHYGPLNKTLDAGIEDIIAPTNAEYHFRKNPTASRPIITVRNSGSSAITSIVFEYGVAGRTPQTYTWTGTLQSLQNRDIELAPLAQLRLREGADYGFSVKILQVNGQADADAANNSLSSVFTPAPAWPADLRVQLIADNESKYNAPGASQTSWKIVDATGNVVEQKQDCRPGALCEQNIHLTDGAYTLIVTDSALGGYYDINTRALAGHFTGDGLNGSFRVYDTLSGMPLDLPTAFSGDFGGSFRQAFYVGSPLSVKSAQAASVRLSAMPNPASNSFTVLVDGGGNREGIIRIVDVTGREVLRRDYRYGMERIGAGTLQSGIYIIDYEGKDGSVARQRIAITH